MEQSDLLTYLCEQLNQLGIRYFITGSHATIAYGEPRFTNDIDVVVDLTLENCDSFCDQFPSEDFYLNRDTAKSEVIRKGMFNIIHPTSGLKIDVVIPSQAEVDELRFSRSQSIPVSDEVDGSFSSAEDIIIQKLRWHQMGGGDRHLRDILGILKIRGDKLDKGYLIQQANTVGVEQLWQELLSKIKLS